MRNNFFRSLVFFLLLVTYQLTNAQVTPVQVTPQLVPPYSLQVSEYYSGSIPKIQVLLINRDINQPTIQVKLKMTVESQNCRLRTKEVNTVPAITLTNGVPYYLAASELQAYFSSANLDFGGGLSEQQYNQTLRFPEGLYTFTFEAYELYSGNLVSNKGFSMGWLTLADPPLLNTPSKGEEVTPNSTQSIVFNWTPRHNTSPTAAYITEYLFTLVEYNDAALSPEAAFASSNPILQKTVSTTSMLFSSQEPITTNLVEGKRYAWRVQAKAKNGAVEVPMFRNNGISEVHWFVYKNSCTAPQGITVNVQGQRATIEWQNNPLHLEWKVEYREQNNPKAEWFTLSNTLPRVVIMDLKPSTNYEYRVGGACYVNQFTYSPLNYFSTANAPVPPVANCGDSTFPALGTAGLQTLNPGDTIRAGSFVVKVGYSTGSGSFTGTGYVIVPWLMNAKVEVKFTNITMSTDYKLVSGLIETTYDPTESGIDDIDEYVDIFKAGYGVGDVVTGEVTADKTVDFIVQWPNGIGVTLPPNYDNQTGQGSGPITIALTPQGGGAATTYTVDKLPTTIKDKDGNLYQVDKTGNISQIGKAGGDVLLKQLNTKVIDKDKAEVKFVDYPTKQVYAFDEWKEVYKKSSTFNKEYERIGDYYVSQKAIAPGQTDYLKAVVTVTDTSVNPRNIEFVNGKGTIYSKKALDSTYKVYEIAIVGGPEKDAQEIYAVYKPSSTKTLNLGKVKVSSYPKQKVTIRLVPVNMDPINLLGIKDSVITAYQRLNVDVDIDNVARFNNTSWDKNSNGKLSVISQGDFSVLTKEMYALNQAYRSTGNVKSDIQYLFVLNQAEELNIKGDMPRGKQFGYIFTSGNPKIGETIVHEIGHGRFHLKHTFDYGIPKNMLPFNAMDYSDGLQFSKCQWDFISDPALVIPVFEKDEASLSVSCGISEFDNFKQTIGGKSYYTFIAPSGMYISLSENTESVTFSTLDRYYVIKKELNNETFDIETDNLAPIGSLISFVIKDETGKSVKYTGYGRGEKFTGYFESGYSADENKKFRSYNSITNPTKGICYLLGVKNANWSGYKGLFKNSIGDNNVQTEDAAGDRLKSIFAFNYVNNFSDYYNRSYKSIIESNTVAGSGGLIETTTTPTPYFANGEMTFTLLYGANITAQQFLLNNLNETSSLLTYVNYLQLINWKKSYFESLQTCINQWDNQNLVAIEQQIQYRIRHVWDEKPTLSPYEIDNKQLYKDIERITEEELVNRANGVVANIGQINSSLISATTYSQVISILEGLTKCSFGLLSEDARKKAITLLVAGATTNNSWNLASNIQLFEYLITTTPALHEREMISHFKSNNSQILNAVFSHYSNKYKIIEGLTVWFMRTEIRDVDIETIANNGRLINLYSITNAGNGAYSTIMTVVNPILINDAIQLRICKIVSSSSPISATSTINTCQTSLYNPIANYDNNINVKPDDWILVSMSADYPNYKIFRTFQSKKISGQVYYLIPACFAYLLFNQEYNQYTYSNADVVNTLLFSVGFAFGISELILAYRVTESLIALRTLLAVTDVAISTSQLILTNDLRNEIKGLDGGEELLQIWDAISAAYTFGRLSTALLPQDYTRLKSLVDQTSSGSKFEASSQKVKDFVVGIKNNLHNLNLPSLIRQIVTKPTYKPFRSIFSKSDKTTTFIGKWDEVLSTGEQNGLQKLYSELSETDLNIYLISGKFENKGGFNMLSIDNFPSKQAEYIQKMNAGQINQSLNFDDYIWEFYNKPWLESALHRGDDIIIWSDPVLSRTGFYKRELDFIQNKASQYGYNYSTGINSGVFSK